MPSPKRIGLILAVLILLTGGDSVAENPCAPSEPCHLRMRDSTTLQKNDGTTYELPPGRFFDEPTWEMVELELKRLQEQETRLEAENKSLRDSLGGWRPGWLTVTSFLVVGLGTGLAVNYWYNR